MRAAARSGTGRAAGRAGRRARRPQALHAELLRRRADGRPAAGTRDRARRPYGAPRRPRRPGAAWPRELAAWRHAAAPRARGGDRSRSPSATTAPTSPMSPRCGASPPDEVARIHAATEFRVAFCGFAPGLRLSDRAAGALRRAAPRDTPHDRPGRVGGARRPVHRRLPALLARRLAADRHDGRRAVGPRARAGRAALAGHPGPLRPAGDRPGGRPHDRPRPRRRTGRGADHRAGPGPPRPRAPGRAPLRAPWTRPRRRWPTGWSATPRARPSWRPRSTAAPCGRVRRSPSRSTGAPCPVTVDGPPGALGRAGAGARRGACWTSGRRSPGCAAMSASRRRRRRAGARQPLHRPALRARPAAADRRRRCCRWAAGRAAARAWTSSRSPAPPARTRAARHRSGRATTGSRPRPLRTLTTRHATGSPPRATASGCARRGPPWSAPGAANCPARAWCWAPSRCRRTAARWSSSPTTRPPAATR